jgi:hypothetical protein
MAAAFWPGLIYLIGTWEKAHIAGPAKISAALFFGLILWAWVGIAAVAIFGDRNNAR